ncbi:MAG TPA: hypothetical protein P5068_18605 [Sedimentisphaerales bacterium]|nr:hypothetical protein [Sedimentisphaerales bacterium]HRV49779.1 hypothetical protein [Sedimentisphaerales bacterium]
MIPKTTTATAHDHAVFPALILVLTGSVLQAAADRSTPCPYFAIQVVDRQTGRGVPLVELKTTNGIRYCTDSNGVVAFCEPGLMDQEVFFFVQSHGYTFPKDGFGYHGVRLKTTPGTTATIQIDRINIAERLYRVTGQGIYRDSILTGRPIPLKNPVLNGQVVGQDSVLTCLYHGRVFWMWGDTGRPSYPLGNFAMSGAVSDLPGRGGLDPAVGVDLDYFVDESGFSRKMAPLKEPGLVWLDGLLTVPDPQANERMIAKFARLSGLDKVLERGLMVYNDDTDIFEPLVRPGLEFLPYRNTGHAFSVEVQGRPYYYFTSPSPMGARLRVRAQWEDVIDANRYEVLTALAPEGTGGTAARWIAFGKLLASMDRTRTAVIEALEVEAQDLRVYDIESGKAVAPHNGTVYYNAHRKRWIGIFVQHFGDPSALGEVWYAEADTPVGPWAYARKIVTHNKYSFYNPKHHPLFDQDSGRTIYFEGTYSFTFSGSEEAATPRYDYNQIMYRLNLDDPRLVLPVPVYHVQGGEYRLGMEGAASVPFFAVEPDRAGNDLIAVYVQNRPAARLTTERPEQSAQPLFFAMPPNETANKNACVVDLYEYSNSGTGQVLYKTDSQWHEAGWKRADKPLCRVWKTPPGPLLLDPQAQPSAKP